MLNSKKMKLKGLYFYINTFDYLNDLQKTQVQEMYKNIESQFVTIKIFDLLKLKDNFKINKVKELRIVYIIKGEYVNDDRVKKIANTINNNNIETIRWNSDNIK